MTQPIGASTGCCHQTPILEVIRALADIGVSGIEIGTSPGHFDIWDRTDVARVRAELLRTGVQPIAIHAPFGGHLDLSDPNPRHREDGMAAIMTAAAVLKEYGGRIVVVHASDIVHSAPDAPTRLQHACEAVRTLQAACAALGMTLALESPLPHLIGGQPHQFAQLLRAAGPGACVCLDTGHTWLGDHWDAFVELARGRLVHVHAHDNRGTFDDHLPPGDGRIDWRRVGQRLGDLQYDGWVVLELACPTEQLGEYFQRSARRLNGLLTAP